MVGTLSHLWYTSPELESVYLEGFDSIPLPLSSQNVKFLHLSYSFPGRNGHQNLFSSCPMLEKFVYRPRGYQNLLDIEGITSAL